MPKYYLCQGCPASGKTTWAEKEMSGNPGSVRLNRDDTRRRLFNFGQWSEYRFTKEKEKRVTEVLDKELSRAASLGYDVYDDNTNLNITYLNKTIGRAEELGFEVIVKQFCDVPLHKLLERDTFREYSVGANVIHRMFRAQLELQGRVITNTEGLPYCIIVDVDGTVADMGKGESWGRRPFDWDKVGNDRPKQNVVDYVKLLTIAHQMWLIDMENNRSTLVGERSCPKVIFLTGRDGVALEETKKWINNNIYGTCYGDVFESGLCEIFIREAGDMRPDCEIKEEILRRDILPRYNVKFCIDDRDQMVDHYRALGLECWQVDAGRF